MEATVDMKAEWCRTYALGDLAALNRYAEAGMYRLLKYKIGIVGQSLVESPDPDIREGYEKIISEAEEAFMIEAEHGHGSLLKLYHPFVLGLMKYTNLKHPPIRPQEIEAARRYRMSQT